MSSLYTLLNERDVITPNAILWFWQLAVDEKDGLTHILCYDMPIKGGMDVSETRPQLACTSEEIYDLDRFSFKFVKNNTDEEILNMVTCPKCYNELVKAWSRAGIIEEGEYDYYYKELDDNYNEVFR